MAKPKALGGLGVRDFQTFNTALLAKTSWRLLQNPDSLLSRVLMGKYCPDNNNILLASPTSTMSHGWRSVLLGRDLLIKNLGWLVGNGQSIQVWHDAWLNTSNQERPMGPPNQAHLEILVSDLMLPESCEWDVLKIQRLVPDYEEKILRIKPSQTGAPDKLIWLGTKSGSYSTKSGYYFVVIREEGGENALNTANFNWKKNVWELGCTPKIRTFAWKLLKGALPVGERLAERHIPIDPSCKRCGAPESITHLFFQCRFARQVWRLAPFTTEVETSGIIDLAAQWPSLCSTLCLPPAGITSKSLAPWILWCLWKSRNKFVFEGSSGSPEDTLSMALNLAREWESKREDETTRKPLAPLSAPQFPSGTVTIRSDAAWTPERTTAGLGWVIFSPEAQRPFSKRVNFVSSALVAEGLALLEAVRSGVSEERRMVAFESDSAQLIRAINSGEGISELYGVIEDILSFASVFEFVFFSWISREKNVQGDRLAKLTLNAVENVVENLVGVGDIIAPN